MKKLFVTGASGLLGQVICKLSKEHYHVHGTYLNHDLTLTDIQKHRLELTHFKDLIKLLDHIKPDIIIHTAANTDINACQRNPQRSFTVNVELTQHLTDFALSHNIPILFTSSDLVFDGDKGNYVEEDCVNPKNIYGEHKVLAEEYLKKYSNAIIARMPLMFGMPNNKKTTLIQSMQGSLSSGQSLKLFADEFRSPIWTHHAAIFILSLLNNKFTGFIHIGGSQRVSRYQFGIMLSDVLKYPHEKIVSCRQSEIKMSAPRPLDVSLNSSKAWNLGLHDTSLIEDFKKMLCFNYE